MLKNYALLILLGLIFTFSACKEDEAIPKSSAKAITEFTFADFSPLIIAKIDPITKTITATVPSSADLTKLKPTIKISDRASINPLSGASVDFSKTVNFTVTSEDASTQIYAVTVTKESSSNVVGTAFFTDVYGGVTGVDTQTGQKVWEWQAIAINNINGCTSPTISDNVLYIGFGSQFFAVDITTKKIKWTYPNSGFAKDRFYSCPIVVNGIIYVDNGSNLLAINAQTGVLAWSTNLGGKFSSSSPTIVNDIVYIGSDNGFLYAIDAKTGSQKWKYDLYKTNSNFKDVDGNPTVIDGIVYVLSTDSNGLCVGLDAVTGVKKWSVDLPYSNSGASPTIYNGIIYFYLGSKQITAFDAKTGNKIWENNNFAVYKSPMVVNDIIYFSDDNGKIIALDALKGQPKSTFSTTELTDTPILVVGQSIFGAKDNTAKAIDNQSGKLLWTYKLGTIVSNTTPIVLTKDGKVFHGGVSGMTN